MRNLSKIALLICLCAMLLISCDKNRVFDSYTSVEKSWNKNDTLSFTFQQPDTLHNYNLFVNIRNNDAYAYQNLFLIVDMNFPNGNVISDTLEYEMAAPDGTWLGSGMTTKESKLWYKENVRFPVEGNYQIDIRHAMRKHNETNGIQDLKGISEVGFRIEKQ